MDRRYPRRRDGDRALFWALCRVYMFIGGVATASPEFAMAFPDVIDMLGMCVSGGMPLGASLEQVAKRMTSHPECASELLLLKRQVELGGMRHALAEFVARVDIPEASQLAALLARSNHLGTELVGSLTNQADHLRLARRQAALREANKTPVKLIFPTIFCFAPAVLILLSAPAIMQMHEYLVTGIPKAGQAKSRDETGGTRKV